MGRARQVFATNRSARREMHVLETFEAGLVLTGTEVKSIRAGKIQLKEAWVEVREGEVWLIGAHVSPYAHGNRENHEPMRPRKLLLARREIDRLLGAVKREGSTIVPLDVFAAGPWIKLTIGLARGKKLHDKRQDEKRRDAEREMRREIGRRR